MASRRRRRRRPSYPGIAARAEHGLHLSAGYSALRPSKRTPWPRPPLRASSVAASVTKAHRGAGSQANFFGAELYGGSCYVKTAALPEMKQLPPKGMRLVACVLRNHTQVD